MGTTDFSNWDFHNFHVQQELNGGQFVSAESTLVASGPPTIDQTNGGGQTGGVYPIGLLESVGIQQSKQLQRLFEIGSSRSYFIPGRVIGSVTVGRTFYFGPSLLRVLYAYYNQPNNPNGINFGSQPPGATITVDGKEVMDPAAQLLDVVDSGSLHTLRRSPGEDYFFIDLASDLFNQPTGLAIYFKDANSISVGAMYLETCHVQGHNMSISSGSVLIMEGVSMQFERLVPIKILT